MAIGIRPGEDEEYILKKERKLPKEEQTIFLIKMMTAEEGAHTVDVLNMNPGGAKYALSCIQMGLIEWRNLKDYEGKEIDFLDEETKLKNLDFLPPEYWAEIADAIVMKNQVSEALKKSSESI